MRFRASIVNFSTFFRSRNSGLVADQALIFNRNANNEISIVLAAGALLGALKSAYTSVASGSLFNTGETCEEEFEVHGQETRCGLLMQMWLNYWCPEPDSLNPSDPYPKFFCYSWQ